jgi:hypothetical protein
MTGMDAVRRRLAGIAAALSTCALLAATAAEQSADTLDDVVVRGKHLAEEIEEAENRFFALFNELNKDDRYDTRCVYSRVRSGGRMQSRICLPEFVIDAIVDWAPVSARCQPPEEPEYGPGGQEFVCLDRNKDGRLSRDEASARSELEGAFLRYDIDPNDGFLSTREFPTDLPAPVVYRPPPPQLVLMEGSGRWYDHMMKVTNSDPRLKQMADHLGGLHEELSAAQRRYDRQKPALPKAKPNPGPRSR